MRRWLAALALALGLVAALHAEPAAEGPALVQVGLVVLAPDHFPEGRNFRDKTADSLARAQALIDAGKGDEMDGFVDPNTGGRQKRLTMPARVYAKFMGPAGPMNFANNAAAVRPGTPVLWVAGLNEDEGPKRNGYAAYQRLPESPPQ